MDKINPTDKFAYPGTTYCQMYNRGKLRLTVDLLTRFRASVSNVLICKREKKRMKLYGETYNVFTLIPQKLEMSFSFYLKPASKFLLCFRKINEIPELKSFCLVDAHVDFSHIAFFLASEYLSISNSHILWKTSNKLL